MLIYYIFYQFFVCCFFFYAFIPKSQISQISIEIIENNPSAVQSGSQCGLNEFQIIYFGSEKS